jgi:hypothetical protein
LFTRNAALRPTTNYTDQGLAAYRAGIDENRCPHQHGTPKALQWSIGWLKGFLRDPLSFDDDLDELRDETEARVAGLEADHLSLLSRIESELPPAHAPSGSEFRSKAGQAIATRSPRPS